ncbi:hypothetical protein JMM61_18515 [Rhodovulum sulfidophilum]|uniref:hypothetical protein n=1 Tax=Rhodovulum sulfidophilum TaxID=35806 RepID=UPI001928C35E|nr:hypothetical protein [Rhodovulum sulfidophilum]MBL3587347.1 hypothetical protein [Rhodovulum sulfidophilum]
MKVKVELRGFEALQDMLRDLLADGEDALRETARELAEDTAEIARREMKAAAGSAPAGSYPHQQSGRLAESVTATHEPRQSRVGSDEIHGYHLEFGTESMEARPWLVPSFEEATAKAEQKLAAKLQEKIG